MEDKEGLGNERGLEPEKEIGSKPQEMFRFGAKTRERIGVVTGNATVIAYTSTEKGTIQTSGETKLRSQTGEWVGSTDQHGQERVLKRLRKDSIQGRMLQIKEGMELEVSQPHKGDGCLNGKEPIPFKPIFLAPKVLIRNEHEDKEEKWK